MKKALLLLTILVCFVGVMSLLHCGPGANELGGSGQSGGNSPVSLTVTAANSVTAIGYGGNTLQFRAVGTLSNGSTQDVTSSATWSTSNSKMATISNAGLLTSGVIGGIVSITASFSGIVGGQNLTIVCPHGTGSQTFNYTGTVQTFTVPACVTTVTISAAGAQGGSGGAGGINGGNGASISSVSFPVFPGDVLNVIVGQAGTNGNTVSNCAGGGGGGTAVYDSTASALLVEMGGGGGGGANDVAVPQGCPASTTTAPNNCGTAVGESTALVGAGGTGGSGGTGVNCGTCNPGGGGGSPIDAGTVATTGTNNGQGGSGGYGAAGGAAGGTGAAGGWGAGGGGGSGCGGGSNANGGGGGGGYKGGGGGKVDGTTPNGDAGGGGGSFCAASCSITATQSGNGSVVIAY